MKRGTQNKIMEQQVQIVASGHKQCMGVDFDHDGTFYAVVKNLSQPAVLAHTAKKDWSIQHIDAKSAYLYAKLKGNTLIQRVTKPFQCCKALDHTAYNS